MYTKKCINNICQAENIASAKFCKKCGNPFPQTPNVKDQSTDNDRTSSANTQKAQPVSNKVKKKGLYIIFGTIATIVIVYTLIGFLIAGGGRFIKEMDVIQKTEDAAAFAKMVEIPEGAKGDVGNFTALVENNIAFISEQILQAAKVTEEKEYEGKIPIFMDELYIADLEKKKVMLFFTSYEIKLATYDLFVSSIDQESEFTMDEINMKVGEEVLIGSFIPGIYEFSASMDTDHGLVEYTDEFVHPNTIETSYLGLNFDTYTIQIKSDHPEAVVYIDDKNTEKAIGEEYLSFENIPSSKVLEVTAKLTVDGVTYDADHIFSTEDTHDMYFTFSEYENELSKKDMMNDQSISEYFERYRSAYESALMNANFADVESYYIAGEQMTQDYREFVNDHRNFEDYQYRFIQNSINSIEEIDKNTFKVISTEVFDFTMEPDGTYHYERQKAYTILYDEESSDFVIQNVEILDTKKRKQ